MRSFKPKFEIPKGAAIDPAGKLCEGLLSWTNAKNGFTVCAVHYTSDPNKRSEEWFRAATKNLRPDQIEREYEIDFESRAGQKAFWYMEQHPDKYQISDIPLDRIPKHWRVIGGLDYGSTNPTAFYLIGVDENRKLHVIYEFYKPSNYREIARAIKGEHEDFPHPLYKRIEKIMVDPSVFRKDQLKDAMQEDMTSIGDILREEFGIWSLYKGQNDRIAGLERIKDLLNYRPNQETWNPNLVFCKRAKNAWREFTRLVYEEIPPHLLMEKNQLEDIKKKDDHAYDSCIASGVLIATSIGNVPIEKIKIGDLVLTRNGYKRVNASGCTGIKETRKLFFSNGQSLVCTDNHPIFTKNYGFTRSDSLSYDCILFSEGDLWKKKKLFLMASFLEDIQTRATSVIENISCAALEIISSARDFCTGKYGSITMGQYQTATTFTTKMEIVSIMRFPILSVSQWKCTTWNTGNTMWINGKLQSIKKFKKMRLNWLRHGTHQKMAESGTVKTQKTFGIRLFRFLKTANNVGQNTKSVLLKKIKPISAEIIVNQNLEGNRAQTMWKRFAMFAKNSILKINTLKQSLAVKNAVRLVAVEQGQRVPVYNLSVDGLPEYFANGLLVHNCRYAAMSIASPAGVEASPPAEYGTLAEVEEFMKSKETDELDFY